MNSSLCNSHGKQCIKAGGSSPAAPAECFSMPCPIRRPSTRFHRVDFVGLDAFQDVRAGPIADAIGEALRLPGLTEALLEPQARVAGSRLHADGTLVPIPPEGKTASRRSHKSGIGRKRPVRFGEGPAEKRTGSYRPNFDAQRGSRRPSKPTFSCMPPGPISESLTSKTHDDRSTDRY